MNQKIFNNKIQAALKQTFVVSTLFLYAACGVATNDEAGATDVFPADLAVASPTSISEDDGTTDLSLGAIKLTGASTASSGYVAATNRINRILNSTSVASCTFDPELLLDQEHDAGCFGPVIEYQAHPDADDATDPLYNGTLPSGDVGLWQGMDTETGHACSAAELNARMEGVSSKSLASLSGLASMVCVINNQGYAMPSSSTLTLTTDMNNLAISDVTFANATLTHAINSSGDDEYTYSLEFTYAPSGASYDIDIDMSHVPGATPAEEYSGQLSYLVTDSFSGGTCPNSDVTHNASLQYVRHAADDMDVQVRSGMFCEHDSDGRDSNNLVDPSDKYSDSNPTGWGNNFSILTANYSPSSLLGDYSYAWQAGPNDDRSRAFNLHVVALAASDVTYTFYGYGDDIASTDGSILGFICNWAGPNSSHTYVETAQFQAVQYDSTMETFVASLENIEYAPTLSCGYDGAGSFIYDTDGDGDMTDESNVTVTEDLFDATDVDSDGTITIEENIGASGYVNPTI